MSCTKLRTLALGGQPMNFVAKEAVPEPLPSLTRLSALTSLAVHDVETRLAGLLDAVPALVQLRVLWLAFDWSVAVGDQLSGLTHLHTLRVSLDSGCHMPLEGF